MVFLGSIRCSKKHVITDACPSIRSSPKVRFAPRGGLAYDFSAIDVQQHRPGPLDVVSELLSSFLTDPIKIAVLKFDAGCSSVSDEVDLELGGVS